MKAIKLKNKQILLIFIILPILLFILMLIILFVDVGFRIWMFKNNIRNVSFQISNPEKIPIIKLNFIPQISARGAIIMDADSKVVLYAKNPSLRFSTASTTKIMTALTALDHFKINSILTVKQATSEGSILGLREGQQFTFESLLYAMLLPSANDAALTISQNYPNGESEFVRSMNVKAEKLQLFNTHYSDPAGLVDLGDYTTPFDLARLSSFAILNPELRKIVGTKEIFIYDSVGNSYKLDNLNKLLGEDGVNGVKTGYTEEAGQVLVTSKLENGKTLIIVVMGSEDRFSDTKKLLDLISNNLTYLSIHP